MNIFDDEVIGGFVEREQRKLACDIFDPSISTPDESKFRADYIKSITAKVKFLLDTTDLAKELPPGMTPEILLEESGKDPDKTFKLIFKYLRGPRGFSGSLDNFVLLTESEYNRLPVKDPNVIYCTYEDEEGGDEKIEGNKLIGGIIDSNVYKSKGNIVDNILKLR